MEVSEGHSLGKVSPSFSQAVIRVSSSVQAQKNFQEWFDRGEKPG
jgi:hypothetical protein